MAKRRTTSRKSKKKSNSFVVFLIVVIILALLSFGISYFMLNERDAISSIAVETESPLKDSPAIVGEKSAEDLQELTHLQGTWVSNYDGTMLTIVGSSCTFESPAVDSPAKTKGTVMVNKTIVTFVFTGNNSCGSAEGHYEYQLEGDGEVFFKKIKDPCQSRSSVMSASWFRL